MVFKGEQHSTCDNPKIEGARQHAVRWVQGRVLDRPIEAKLRMGGDGGVGCRESMF